MSLWTKVRILEASDDSGQVGFRNGGALEDGEWFARYFPGNCLQVVSGTCPSDRISNIAVWKM